MAVRGDPMLPVEYQIRDLKGYSRHAKGIGKSGYRKKAFTKGQQSAMRQLENQIIDRSSSLSSLDNHPSKDKSSSSDAQARPPTKKHRLSQDKHLALSSSKNMLDEQEEDENRFQRRSCRGKK